MPKPLYSYWPAIRPSRLDKPPCPALPTATNRRLPSWSRKKGMTGAGGIGMSAVVCPATPWSITNQALLPLVD